MRKITSIILCFLLCFIFSFNVFAQGAGASSEKLPMADPDLIVEYKWGANPVSMVTFTDNLKLSMGKDTQPFPIDRELKPFSINKFETTYGLWYVVKKEAEKIGYRFKNAGQAGTLGRNGRKPTEKDFAQPVVMVSWYDAVIWCNAYSELTGRTPCYTFNGEVLKDSRDTASCDLSTCNWNADGYRLPSETEWEYAAKRIKNHDEKNKDIFQPGNLISGQLSKEEDGLFYAWTDKNADKTKVVGTSGTLFEENSVAEMGTGNPNGAGIFDMSGNVIELCWDWFEENYKDEDIYGPDFGYERVSRGGSWSPYTTLFVFAEDRYSYNPNTCYDYMGFRICSSLAE